MDFSLPRTQGYTVRARYLVEGQAKCGHTPTILTGPSHGPESEGEETRGIRYLRCPFGRTQAKLARGPIKSAFMYACIKRRVRGLLAGGNFDVVHAHTPFTVALPALHAARAAGVPCVYEKRNLWEESAKARGKLTGKWPLLQTARAVDRHVTRRADAVCTITGKLREHAVGMGADPARVVVVGNGVDTDRFQPVPPEEELRARLLDGGDVLVGYIGSFFRFEGLLCLVRAAAKVVEKAPNVRFFLVGDGEDLPEVKRLTRELGLETVCHIPGRIPFEEVASYYGAADILVYPRLSSVLTEMISPLKPLEAMAMGKCVLASRIGGLEELISDRATGYLVTPDAPDKLATAIEETATSPLLRKRLGAAAREYVVRERQWDKMAEAYDNAYAGAFKD